MKSDGDLSHRTSTQTTNLFTRLACGRVDFFSEKRSCVREKVYGVVESEGEDPHKQKVKKTGRQWDIVCSGRFSHKLEIQNRMWSALQQVSEWESVFSCRE